MAKYILHSIIPTLRVPEPISCGPIVFCTTQHLADYAIEPDVDAETVKKIATSFRDAFGKPLEYIGLELVPTDTAARLAEESLGRVSRDALAMSFITGGAAQNSHREQRVAVHETDYFDVLPVLLRDDGLVINRPGLLSYNNTSSLDRFQPSLRIDIGIPSESDFKLDTMLFSAFSKAVEATLAGQYLQQLRQIYRAVAISLWGCRILHETDTTFYDLTTRIGAWVSAFETLVHPDSGRVGINHVLNLVDEVTWFDERLVEKSFPSNSSENANGLENAPAYLYRSLYGLRNDLAHGNPIVRGRFAARCDSAEGARIDEVIPLLFRECLLQQLRNIGVINRVIQNPQDYDSIRESVSHTLRAMDYHEALADAMFGDGEA
ncbi:MAG: hypothetical protein AABZ47_01380 [Planctomycetota bacterium]